MKSAPFLPLLAFVPVLLVLLVLPPVTLAQSCSTISSQFCSPVITSYISGKVSGDPSILAATELILESQVTNLTLVLPFLAPDCFEFARKLLCGVYFPACDNTTGKHSEVIAIRKG